MPDVKQLPVVVKAVEASFRRRFVSLAQQRAISSASPKAHSGEHAIRLVSDLLARPYVASAALVLLTIHVSVAFLSSASLLGVKPPTNEHVSSRSSERKRYAHALAIVARAVRSTFDAVAGAEHAGEKEDDARACDPKRKDPRDDTKLRRRRGGR